MDFGANLDSEVVVPCSDNNTNSLFSAASSDPVSDVETKQKWYGSVGFLKPNSITAECDIRDSKIAKTAANTVLIRNPFVGSEGQQMLCFSAPYYHHASFSGNSAYGSGGLSGGNMHGGVKGPFTPSQWMELEHQALIYKYITANVPIPPYLLNPIRKALESAAISTFGLRTDSLGWGGFHVGFSNSSDPEPGRCRRTDGKKWRCSRDAFPDQKYCERHMNRGRHRSRKPVEGPSRGHSVSSGTTTAAAKMMPAGSSSMSAAVVSGGGTSNTLVFSHHNQLNNLQPSATNPSVSSHLGSRRFLDKEYVGERYQDPKGLTITSPILNDRQYSLPKDHNPYEESSSMLKFGLVCTDSLLNPLSKNSSLVNCRNYSTSEDVSDHENKSQHPLRQFMDVWPKNQSDQSIDFMSSMSSSPTNDKLSREIEATQMRLGVGTAINEQNSRQGNWIPISWEPSMGGPLGEVLHGTNSRILGATLM